MNRDRLLELVFWAGLAALGLPSVHEIVELLTRGSS